MARRGNSPSRSISGNNNGGPDASIKSTAVFNCKSVWVAGAVPVMHALAAVARQRLGEVGIAPAAQNINRAMAQAVNRLARVGDAAVP